MNVHRTSERKDEEQEEKRKKIIKPSMCAYTFERTRPCAGGELAIAACARDEGVVYEHWYEYTRRARARTRTHTHLYRQTLFETQEKEKRVEEINCRRRRKELRREQDASTIAKNKRK